MRLPFSGEKSGAIALVLPGLTAGWLAGRLVDKIVLIFLNAKIFLNFQNYILNEIFEFLLCLTKVQCYYRRTNTF